MADAALDAQTSSPVQLIAVLPWSRELDASIGTPLCLSSTSAAGLAELAFHERHLAKETAYAERAAALTRAAQPLGEQLAAARDQRRRSEGWITWMEEDCFLVAPTAKAHLEEQPFPPPHEVIDAALLSQAAPEVIAAACLARFKFPEARGRAHRRRNQAVGE